MEEEEGVEAPWKRRRGDVFTGERGGDEGEFGSLVVSHSS